ncbi:MAG: hypothetical protein ACLP5J_22150 [Mycobacterium sp.]|jgi:hypothetical protein
MRAASRPQGGKLEQFVGDHSSSAWLADTGGHEHDVMHPEARHD